MTAPMLVEFDIHPERRDEFVSLLTELLDETRAFEGCEEVLAYVDEGAPGRVLLFETWTERANHEAYMQWRMKTGLAERIAPYVAGPMRIAFLRPAARR